MSDVFTDYYTHRFSGVARIYGPQGLVNFARAHILVIGLGGVGSWVVEALARSGVGELTLVDFDDICVSNFNRQIHAIDKTVGKFKVDTMAERVKSINTECKVHCINDRFSEETAELILSSDYTFVIDAFDNSFGKSFLIHLCKKKKIPLLVLGSVGGKSDPSKIKIDDLSRSAEDSLLSAVRKKLRSSYGFPKGKDKKFSVPCVYSTEKYVYLEDGCLVATKPKDSLKALDCAGGMGAITHLSASFAFFGVSYVLRKIAEKQ
jgi:tRNA threonylcarbamoyladenosine dehydratase